MRKIWVLVKKNQKIIKQTVTDFEETTPLSESSLLTCLSLVCKEFDIPRPLIFKKHMKQLEDFGRTIFRQDSFVEPIAFDSFDIEWIEEKTGLSLRQ